MDNTNMQLLAIFDEKDINKYDLVNNSGLIERYSAQLRFSIAESSKAATEVVPEAVGGMSEIARIIRHLINSDQMVASLDGISKEILDKLRAGEYVIPDSKQVGGQLRPCIVDQDNQIVKWLTLKEVKDPDALLADTSNLAVQMALHKISEKLESLSKDIDYLIGFERRKYLQDPFFDARDALCTAALSRDDGLRADSIRTAINDLRGGLNAIRSDYENCIKQLADLYCKRFSKLADIDKMIAYVTEDINLIPKYVSLLSYVYNVFGEYENSNRVVMNYKAFIGSMMTEYLGTGKKQVTAAELLQMTYQYSDVNRDFWMNEPQKLYYNLDALSTLPTDDSKPRYLLAEYGGQDNAR